MNYFNRFQDHFAGLDQELQFILLGLFLLGCLFAFLLGFFLRSAGLKKYKTQLLLAQKDQASYEQQYKAANEKQQILAREVEQLSTEKVAAIDELTNLKRKVATLHIDPLPNNWEEQEAAYQEEVQLLEAEVNRLQAALTTASQVPAPPAVGSAAGSTTVIPADNTALSAYLEATEVRFQQLEAKLTALGQENKKLETELLQVSDGQHAKTPTSAPFGTPHRPIVGTPAVATDASGEPLTIRADVTLAGLRTNHAGETEVIIEGGQRSISPLVSAAIETTTDDLQQIKNIGPFLSEKLHGIGIVSYAQIASWSPEEIDEITKRIGYLPGRIHLDDWVGQAKVLLQSSHAQVATQQQTATQKIEPERAKPNESTQNNLKVIEGIGPKIEQILKAQGIADLATLSVTKPEQLKAILADAGSRYQMHDPSSWPAQADLAKNEQWIELQLLQEKLKSGR